MGIECINEGKIDRALDYIEKRVDIGRARKAGMKTDMQICWYLNGGE